MGFRWKIGSVGSPRKLQNFKSENIYLIVAAVTWLKYCRYGVKLYPINQSNVQLKNISPIYCSKFTWNSCEKFTWNLRETSFTWNSHAAILPVYEDFFVGGGQTPQNDCLNLQAILMNLFYAGKANCLPKSTIDWFPLILHFSREYVTDMKASSLPVKNWARFFERWLDLTHWSS